MIDPRAASELQRHLQSDERLLWTGRPAGGIKFRSADWFLVPFSFLWVGGALFWEASVIAMGGPWFFMLFGAVFVLIGLFFAVGRFLFDAHIRAGQVYAVSNRRVIVKSSFPKMSLRSFDLGNLPGLTLKEGTGSAGSIGFAPTSTFGFASGNQFGLWIPAMMGTSFEFIQDVNQVYKTILGAQAAKA